MTTVDKGSIVLVAQWSAHSPPPKRGIVGSHPSHGGSGSLSVCGPSVGKIKGDLCVVPATLPDLYTGRLKYHPKPYQGYKRGDCKLI